MTIPTVALVVDERAEIADQISADPARGRMPLTEWYLDRHAKGKELKERIKAQAAAMIAQVDAELAAIDWRWGAEFRKQVDADLAATKGKRKSVKYLTGTAGYRQTPGKLVFKDAEALVQWASENLPEAIKLTARKTPVAEHIKLTGEIPPGVEWVAPCNQFFPAAEQANLEDHSDDRTDDQE